MAATPLRIRKHTTEFGTQWKVTNQGVVISIHRTGSAALAWLHKELVAVRHMQAEQERQKRVATLVMKRMQDRTDKELVVQKLPKELGT